MAYLLYKRVKDEYFKDISNGIVHFSCCEKYIEIAKKGCGKGQGDEHECVFAKYLKENSSKPIKKYKNIFDDDLQVEEEGDYVLLRRKSSLLIPTSCFYGIDGNIIINNLKDEDLEYIKKIASDNPGKNEIKVPKIPFYFGDKYLDDFGKEDETKGIYIVPKKFKEEMIRKKVKFNKVAYIDENQEYDIFKDKFYNKYFDDIMNLKEAFNYRVDMFFKDKSYSHQNEYRFIIPTMPFNNFKEGKEGTKIKLDGLIPFDVSKAKNSNRSANGKDLIYNYGNDKNMILYFNNVTLQLSN